MGSAEGEDPTSGRVKRVERCRRFGRPLLEKREKGRTPVFFTANTQGPPRYTWRLRCRPPANACVRDEAPNGLGPWHDDNGAGMTCAQVDAANRKALEGGSDNELNWRARFVFSRPVLQNAAVTMNDPRTYALFAGASGALGVCATGGCQAAAIAATGFFHAGLRAGMVIGGYIMTTHAAEQADKFDVTEEEIEEAVSGVPKGNPNPERAWDSVQRFYTATCEVRVNKITGTIVTVISKIKR